MTREETANICKALSDSNRLRIVELLITGERCACELNEDLNITQPTLSHHMKVLGDCGLVFARKEGKWMKYSINCARFREFKAFISMLECCGTPDTTAPGGGCDMSDTTASGSSCCSSAPAEESRGE